MIGSLQICHHHGENVSTSQIKVIQVILERQVSSPSMLLIGSKLVHTKLYEPYPVAERAWVHLFVDLVLVELAINH